MRESKARRRILEVAEAMFKRVGYSDLNVNEIAREAGVSVGTLYYHFPQGKTSILLEVRGRIADHYEGILTERLDRESLRGAASFDEGLRMLLELLIDIHRDERLVLAAMESEVLSNLASYDKVAESLSMGELMESDAKPVIGVMEMLLEEHPGEGLSINGRGGRVNKIMDVLIHRYVYVEYLFGSQEEFLDMMVRIVRALLE
jgi:AcrR family transcriptional regulator